MNLKFYNTNDPNNKIHKNLSYIAECNAVIKGECSVQRPTFTLETNPEYIGANYLYCDNFVRYYYITDIVARTGGRVDIVCSVDPLMSFADKIEELPAILGDSQAAGADPYLDSPSWVRNCKTKTDIINFPAGLNDSGEYVLITAGG